MERIQVNIQLHGDNRQTAKILTMSIEDYKTLLDGSLTSDTFERLVFRALVLSCFLTNEVPF